MTTFEVLSLVIGAVGALAGAAGAIATYIAIWPRRAARTAWRVHGRLYRYAQARSKRA